jgi:ribosome-associated protein
LLEEKHMTDSETNTTAATDDEVQVVELMKQPIDLFKILKFEGLVASGGEAKAAIAGGLVTLNAVVETQKRKKIVSGDILEFDGVSYRMHCDEAIESGKLDGIAADENKKNVAAADKPVRKSIVNTKRKMPAPSRAGRKAIGIKS